ncbi:hypothetical protein H3Z85_17910 [Chryseobacterium indologenes]|uniref:hypothetical protein n=1 Tax=Chryseobacterium indologenes TaxID=253 RepID=UPI0008EB8A9C|nr:hypothetical protein [Chryseobacterium indologenes]QPQ51185.1 hypothetical protein H3Z85_17910 [Chryseobacterium indologenes]SFK01323.1 hypothetical protein SAMN05421692_3128 [Chryseobacterium indologenes]SUX49572.1 Uncharacterised protein [Chryseobacterium indologenes]
MGIYYFKPVINNKISEDLTDESNLLIQDFRFYANGKNLLDDIIVLLLTKGHHISNITRLINRLHETGSIKESNESELNSFQSQELETIMPQLKALSTYSYDKKTFYTPFSNSAVKHQNRIKKSNTLLLGCEEWIEELTSRLKMIGIESIYRYITNFENDKEWENLNDLAKNLEPDIIIYIPKFFSKEDALRINEICITNGINFLPYELNFPDVRIGPFYIHNETSCYNCYLLRKAGSRNPFAQSEINQNQSDFKNFMLFPGFDFISLEIIKFYSGFLDVISKNRVWNYNLHECKTHTEIAFKLPRCPLCGTNHIKPKTKLWEYYD